jgi:hypothetical protein
MTTPGQASVKPRKFPWWIYWILLAVIVVFMISPIIPVSIAEMAAKDHGCTLNEGSATPCIVDGKDIGPDIYTMGMMGWLFLATAPLGIGALLLWIVVAIIHRVVWGRRHKTQVVQQ